MNIPIVVCSKGRPTDCPTIRTLEQTSLLWFVQLEKADVAPYIAAGLDTARIIELPESGQGIAYTRQYALDGFRKRGLGPWMWMLDDDIKKWFRIVEKRCKPCTIVEALEGAAALFVNEPRVALAALEYQQIAWSSDKPVKRNGYCDVAVCVNLERTALVSYRGHLNGKEDRDFAMQTIAGGWETLRVQRFAFGCPPIGSNAGGLEAFYAQRSNVERTCARLLEAWGPGVVTIVEKKNGLPDAKINWRALANKS